MRFKYVVAIVIVATIIGIIGTLIVTDSQLRDGALEKAMTAVIEKKNVDSATVASVILQSHHETRVIAALWSSMYWGFAWGAAVLSALAGLVLKVESILPDEKLKKDIAALLTVVAALLVTISTSGDFQRKWQANRTASAEIERTGFAFLEQNGADSRTFLREVGNSLQKRHLAILGSSEARKVDSPASAASSAR